MAGETKINIKVSLFYHKIMGIKRDGPQEIIESTLPPAKTGTLQ